MFYTDIIYLLLAIVLFSSWPSEDLYLDPYQIFFFWFLKEILYVAVAAISLRRATTPRHFLRYQSRLKILAFFFFAADVFALELPALFARLFPEHWSFLQDFAGLLVFIQYLVVLWTVSALYERRAPLATVSVPGYVMAHLRLLLPFLVPWFLVNLALEGALTLWGGNFLSRYEGQIQVFYLLIFILTLVIMVPPLSVWVWQCLPLPDSNLRRLIIRYLEQERTTVREILLWGAFEGRLLTAGVIGLFRRFRYLLLTPGLLAALEEPEVLSVVAHEVGHLKRRHMWWLLVFFLSFSLLIYAAFPPAYLALLAYFPWPDLLLRVDASYVPEVLLSLFLLVLVLFYFRVLFGLYLRNFERQADLYCLESLGTAEGLIRSLKKIAALSGQTERLPSWHHYSIAERISFLRAAMLNPALIQRHHRRVKFLLAFYLIVVFGLTIVAWQIPREKLERRANLNFWKAKLLRQVRYLPDLETYDLLAEIALEEGHEAEAIRYYEKALALDPQDPRLLNNLAWLLVTAKDHSLCDPKRALNLARQAVAKAPLAIYLDTLAEAWFAAGNPGRACLYEIMAWSRAQEAPDFYPQGPFYQKQMERFCQAAKRKKKQRRPHDPCRGYR